MNSILVFARALQPGQVKTRLAAHIGDEMAAQLYAAMLQDTLAVAKSAAEKCEAEVVVCYTPDDAFAPGKFSLSYFWHGAKLPQIGADLGEKMRLAISNRLVQGAERVLIIGSDMPDLEANILQDAFDKLTNHDLVFGPAQDGGFYLIGARSFLPDDIFDGVEWSRKSTLQSVLHIAHGLNLTVALLPEGADVDEWSDVQKFASDEELQQKAPHFWAALRAERFWV